ncbi:terminase large subunit [Wukongibacter sp. M2B1]|uniref:terminase large subunit n=1 Tax=Wukongibacter sp. M2B1 TaxID=3088895 RepID=UPI003D79F967
MQEKFKKQIDQQKNWTFEKVIKKLQAKYDNDKYYYDKDEAIKFYKFSSKLELDKGKKGQTIELLKFQFEICSSIICVKRRSDNLRRFREVHINIPRKNGKSFIIALIVTYLYFCHNEYGSETIISANSSQQASLLFNTIQHMVKHNATLSKHVKITDSRKYMYKKNMNAYLRVISSDASNADSYAGIYCILDEIHEAKNGNLYDKMRTGMGIWDEPILMTITTASSGQDPNNLEMELYNYSKGIEKGEMQDESFFYAIYEAENGCNLLDEKQWFKSNPALGTFRKYEDLKGLALKASKIKTREASFRRLYLNQHVALDGEGGININLWDSCTADITLKDLKGMTYCGGLDMSSTQDISAYLMVFYDDDRDKYIVYPYLFTPKDTLFERTERDSIRYDVYVKQGDLIALKGKSIDYEAMFDYIEENNEKYELDTLEIAFDRWGAIGIRSKLEKKYTVFPFGQGYRSMSPVINDFENLLLDGKIIIADNKFLRFMATNVVAVEDDAGNVKYSKKRSKNKIDGIIAMLMGLSRAIFNNTEETIDLNEHINNYLEKMGD